MGGATGPNAFDCSGLTQWAYRQAGGVNIPRTTYDLVNAGTPPVSRANIRAGDLILCNWQKNGRPEHVVMAVSPDMVIEAPNKKNSHVKLASIPPSGHLVIRRVA